MRGSAKMLGWLLFSASLACLGFFTCCCAQPSCKCAAAAPTTMRVTISGLANSNCTSCATFDGTYDCILNDSNPFACVWHYYFPGGTACDAYQVSVFNATDSFGGAAPGMILVRLRFFSSPVLIGDVYWSTTVAVVSGVDTIDCALSSLSVPFDRNGTPLGITVCDGAASTASVTAIP